MHRFMCAYRLFCFNIHVCLSPFCFSLFCFSMELQRNLSVQPIHVPGPFFRMGARHLAVQLSEFRIGTFLYIVAMVAFEVIAIMVQPVGHLIINKLILVVIAGFSMLIFLCNLFRLVAVSVCSDSCHLRPCLPFIGACTQQPIEHYILTFLDLVIFKDSVIEVDSIKSVALGTTQLCRPAQRTGRKQETIPGHVPYQYAPEREHTPRHHHHAPDICA